MAKVKFFLTYIAMRSTIVHIIFYFFVLLDRAMMVILLFTKLSYITTFALGFSLSMEPTPPSQTETTSHLSTLLLEGGLLCKYGLHTKGEVSQLFILLRAEGTR